MAKSKKIIWTIRAQEEKNEILAFWLEHNKSAAYPKKLNQLFHRTTRFIQKYPKIGKPTDIETNIRVKIIRQYGIFYKITPSAVYILSVWDFRRRNSQI